jgi:hypothetical protein
MDAGMKLCKVAGQVLLKKCQNLNILDTVYLLPSLCRRLEGFDINIHGLQQLCSLRVDDNVEMELSVFCELMKL